MGDEEGRQFTSDPADYNRVLCMVCRAKIKVRSDSDTDSLTLHPGQVHHMKKHLQSHQLTVRQYKETHGQDWLYVKKFHHRCGICQEPVLFDLETIYNHLSR